MLAVRRVFELFGLPRASNIVIDVAMRATGLFFAFCLVLQASKMPGGAIAPYSSHAPYFWSSTAVGDSAQLLTLLCHGCSTLPENQGFAAQTGGTGSNVPLLSVLLDNLGDSTIENDRITAVWLLSYIRPSIPQRLLAAVPFFYWRIGNGSVTKSSDLSPLLDMNSLQRPMLKTVARDVLQWAMLDPSFMPVRASSRAYRSNVTDRERLYLEEAISYLQAAPGADESGGLTPAQLHTLIARLELRKRLLGGFVTPGAAARFGESAETRHEQVRSRNWELLRQCADKTGLYFEPLRLAGRSGEYAMLWAPVGGITAAAGTRVSSIWKLLNMKKPSLDELRRLPSAAIYERGFGENGQTIPVVPLGVYSLDYPKVPLLLIDFRNRRHVRWRAVAQRSIDDITAGVIGISHFTNWYFYVAADVYDFVATRRGAPMNQSERLDCYAQFRVNLALDQDLDQKLRAAMRDRIDSLAMNPLESSPEEEKNAGVKNFASLLSAAEDGRLLARVQKDRRQELASYDSSAIRNVRDEFYHLATFGVYTRRAKPTTEDIGQVSSIRRAQYHLSFLGELAKQGTPPEVMADSGQIKSSIAELEQLLPQIHSEPLLRAAKGTVVKLRGNSENAELQSDCTLALAHFRQADGIGRQVALKPAVVRASAVLPKSE